MVVEVYWLSGVRAPARLPGRSGTRLSEPDAKLKRLLGRLAPAPADGGRSKAVLEAGRSAAEAGRGMPKERRLM